MPCNGEEPRADDYSLHAEPLEEKATADTWVVGPILRIVDAYEQGVKHPPMPMATTEPYTLSTLL
jgi:hypothetical protein